MGSLPCSPDTIQLSLEVGAGKKEGSLPISRVTAYFLGHESRKRTYPQDGEVKMQPEASGWRGKNSEWKGGKRAPSSFHLLRHEFKGKECGWTQQKVFWLHLYSYGKAGLTRSLISPGSVLSSFIKILLHGGLIKQNNGPNLTTLSGPGRVRPGWEFASVPKTESSRWTEGTQKI